MREFVLSYYSEFNCVAEKCKHTCCAGWKMNVDKDSLESYKNERSSYAETLKKGINYKKLQFKVDKSGRCAFLNDKGLCEIIINLGENRLCQVCRDHPRFRSFFDDRIEMGLGFCCEEATRIILSYKDKITPILVKNGEENQLDFIQRSILEFRSRALDIVQNRSACINDRIETLLKLCKTDFSPQDFNKIAKVFLTFEKLDKSWTKRLKTIKKKPFVKQTNENLSLYCEQFLVNGFYRHLSEAEDTLSARYRAVACVFAWFVVKAIIDAELTDCDDLSGENFALIVDIVRAYSAEVEYSQKNLDKFFSFADKFVKIR